MSGDLTRWNRSGLSRLRYVEGTAITYLETLRRAMRSAFVDENGQPRWTDLGAEPPANESERDAYDRLIEQYRASRKDYAWEILRTFARATHVLTEHLDAYANEGFLRTATQWDNVRKLVETIDYHPAPPASASTALALFAKVDEAGTVEAGFQVKNEPEDGSASVIFETLDDLEVDARLNELHAADWQKSQEAFTLPAASNSVTFELAQALEEISAGGLGVLVLEDSSGAVVEALPVVVASLTEQEVQLTVLSTHADRSVLKSQMRLLLGPETIATPLIFGSDTIELDRDVAVTVGDRVAWTSGSSWTTAEITEIEKRRVRLRRSGGTVLPGVGDTLYRMVASTQSEGTIIIPFERGGEDYVWGEDFAIIDADDIDSVTENDTLIREEIRSTSRARAFYVYKDSSELGKVARASLPAREFSGSPGELTSGAYIVAAVANVDRTGFASGTAMVIAQISEGEGDFALTFESAATFPEDGVLYGAFAQEILPGGHDRNELPIAESSSAGADQTTLRLELSELPPALEKGRLLIVRDGSQSELVTVRSVEWMGGIAELVVEPELSASFIRADTVILGNVVKAGHGESQPAKVLGSGDATRSGQEMLLQVEAASFVPDSSMSSGVAADVELTVDGQTWQQVATLSDSEPEDPHYVIHLTEEGYLLFRFGDGFHGRRLPTGRSNVRINYRIGVGLAGNLPAGSLAKPVKPHVLLDSVEQSLVASGGNDLEDVASLRANAPPSVLALERAVSLSDFSALAASNSGVWQAKAFELETEFAYHESVRVAVVPAGGGLLGPLADEIESFLSSHAIPGVRVEVVDFRPVYLQLTVTVRVKSEQYDPDTVVASVLERLRVDFSLEKRALGAPLYRSEVFAAVEAVEGVENCDCQIEIAPASDLTGVVTATGPDGAARVVRVAKDQVLHLDESISTPQIEAREFTL